MLYVNSDGTIQLTRGDTARFNLTIKNITIDISSINVTIFIGLFFNSSK